MPTHLEYPGQAIGAVHVVVDEEDAVASAPGRWNVRAIKRGLGCLGLPDKRQTDNELTSLVGPTTLDLYAAAVQLHKPPNEGQTDAQPALGAIQRAVYLR